MCYDLYYLYDCIHLKTVTGQEVFCERFVRKDQPCKNKYGQIRKHWLRVKVPEDDEDTLEIHCPSCVAGATKSLSERDADRRFEEFGEWDRYQEDLATEQKLRRDIRCTEAKQAVLTNKEYNSKHWGLKGGITRPYSNRDNLDGKYDSVEVDELDSSEIDDLVNPEDLDHSGWRQENGYNGAEKAERVEGVENSPGGHRHIEECIGNELASSFEMHTKE